MVTRPTPRSCFRRSLTADAGAELEINYIHTLQGRLNQRAHWARAHGPRIFFFLRDSQEWWGAGVVVCLEQDADLHMAQLMPLPLTVYCFSKIQIVFTFLVPAHLESSGKKAVKRVCVCVRGPQLAVVK